MRKYQESVLIFLRIGAQLGCGRILQYRKGKQYQLFEGRTVALIPARSAKASNNLAVGIPRETGPEQGFILQNSSGQIEGFLL
jgi:hypothetical protein